MAPLHAGREGDRLAAVRASDGRATAWNPNAKDTIGALALSGSTVCADGNFTALGPTRSRASLSSDRARAARSGWVGRERVVAAENAG